MKILHIISSVNPQGGGPIEGIKQLQPLLKQLGITVEVACCDAPDAPWLATCSLPIVHTLGPTKNKYGYTTHLIRWLHANASRFDAIIVNGIWQYIGFAVRQALVGTQIPYFVFTHGMLDPWFKHTYPFKHLKKWLYWPWAEYRVLRDARRVIFTCEDERLLARESFWLYKVNEAVTAYGVANPPANANDLSSNFIVQYPHLKGKRIALYLSRIHEKKGCDLLIEAFAKVASRDERLHLVIVGPDQTGWVAKLKTQAVALNIAHRITWIDMLQGDLKWGAFYSAEVFCLPSHQENFGIVVAEALACGRPVLISNKVNIWREIEADGAGLVDEDTLGGTIKNFERWLAMNSAEFDTMKARTTTCFAKRFHVRHAADRLVEIIKDSAY